jgi:hypothetical protein
LAGLGVLASRSGKTLTVAEKGGKPFAETVTILGRCDSATVSPFTVKNPT